MDFPFFLDFSACLKGLKLPYMFGVIAVVLDECLSAGVVDLTMDLMTWRVMKMVYLCFSYQYSQLVPCVEIGFIVHRCVMHESFAQQAHNHHL